MHLAGPERRPTQPPHSPGILPADYNELCPLAVGMAIREVTGMSLSEFAEDALWTPLGAEADATWTTVSRTIIWHSCKECQQ